MELPLQNASLDDLNLLVEISSMFALHDVEDVLSNAIDLAVRAVGADNASLVVNPKSSEFIEYYTHTPVEDSEDLPKITRTILQEGLAGWVLRNRQMARVDDTASDPRWKHIPEQTEKIGSALCLPVIYRDDLLGILTLVHEKPRYFTDNHMRILTVIVNQAALAIHNARMYETVHIHRRRLENVLQTIPDALLVLNSDGLILETNGAGRRLLAADWNQNLVGMPINELLIRDESLKPVSAHIDASRGAPKTATPIEFEAHSEWLKRDLFITLTPWHDDELKRHGYVLILRDITQLRDLNRFKDEMLRLASHDLRSPLNLIVGYTDMIATDTPDPESPVHGYVEVIRQASTRMNALLEDMLRIEQIRQSPLELQEAVDPEQLVKVAIINTRASAGAKNLHFEAHINMSDQIELMVDPVLVRQAMENLIVNAIKYTPEGGSINIYATGGEGRLTFIVEDTGIGIDEASLPHVFNAFYRARQKGTEDITGTGLGLNLVKDVIERHGGDVWVNSKPGKGSQFGFWLPFTPKEIPDPSAL